MAYPTTIDTPKDDFTNDTVAQDTHPNEHNLVADSIVAIETKVGVDGSAVNTTHDYKLSGVADGDKAVSLTGTETLTNKILTAPKVNLGSDASQDIYKRKADGTLERVPMGNANEVFGVNGAGDSVGYQPISGVTTDEKDAIAGVSGTDPSSTNKFMDELSMSGIVSPYAGATAPTGWLLCDGQAVSRTTYSRLFDIVSTTYGAGDGTTTFNVPNLKGKVPVGLNSAETEFDALGETGGAKTHGLTTAQIPSHTHTIPISAGDTGGSLGTLSGGTGLTRQNTGATGGGEAHNNLQPYITLNYIIKT